MTTYIYNEVSDLPALGPELGDEAFVRENNTGYLYEDLSSILSYSYGFAGAGELVADSVLAGLVDNDFSLRFWSFTTDEPDRNYFSFDAKNKIVTVTDVANSLTLDLQGTTTVLPISPIDGSSLYFNGIDNVVVIQDAAANLNILEPYTFEYWARKNTTSDPFEIFSIKEDHTSKVSIRDNQLISNGVDFTFDNSPYVYDSWGHHSITYDGFNHRYFNNGVEINLTPNNSYEASFGTQLGLNGFERTIDAAFQFQTEIPINVSDGTVFSLGTGSQQTKLEFKGAGSQIELTAKDLSVTTSDIPNDSDNHIISWDYQIDPKRIRLFIDGDLKGTSQSSGQMENGTWVDLDESFFNLQEIQVSSSDVIELPFYRYYGDPGFGKYSVQPFTRVENGNFYFNETYNIRRVYAIINGQNSTYVDPNGNNIYYFEHYPLGNQPFYGAPFLVSKEADIHDPNLYIYNWTGDYPRSFRNFLGLSINRFNTRYAYANRINSTIIDENTGSVYNFVNGNIVGTDAFGPENMTTPSVFSLGFQSYRINYNNPENDPTQDIKFAFNKKDWILNPIELYYKAVGGSSSAEGEYAGASKPSWLNPSKTSNLRYYPQSFGNINQKSMIGSNLSSLVYSETGAQYAQKYVSDTNGNIVNYSTPGDITTVISNLSDGDALVLSPGSYTALGVQMSGSHSTLFGGKRILICGSTSNPQDVELDYTPDNSLRDIPIFDGSSDRNTQISYLKLKRNSFGKTRNYQVAIHRFSKGGKLYRCIIDSNNLPISWCYDSSSLPIKRYVTECQFINYSSWIRYYSGDLRFYNVVNCKFSKEYGDKGVINEFGTNEENCTFYSNQSRNVEYKGYLFDASLSNSVLYDSDFTVPGKKIPSSSTELLIESKRRGDNLILYRPNGSLIINDTKVDSIQSNLNDWIYHAISYDGSSLRVFQNGDLKSTISTNLDSFDLSQSVLYIGSEEVVNSVNVDFDKSYYKGSIKDFSLSRSDSDYSGYVPTEDKVGLDSDELFFIKSSNSPPGSDQLTYNGSFITSDLFSPYTEATKGWIPLMLVSSAYSNVSIGTLNNKLDPQFIFEFDSNDFYDSSVSLDLYIKTVEKDDLGNDLTWDYEILAPSDTITVGKRGNNEFLIKRDRNISFHEYTVHNSSLFLNSFLVDSDSKSGSFSPIPVNVPEIKNDPIMINYDRFFANVDISLSPIPLRLISSFEVIDSNFNDSGFVYDNQSPERDRLNPERSLRIYDSFGELPG